MEILCNNKYLMQNKKEINKNCIVNHLFFICGYIWKLKIAAGKNKLKYMYISLLS